MGAELPAGWTLSPVEDCMAAIIDYRGKSPTKTTFGVPLITAKVVKDGRILPTDEFIAESDYESWMRRGLPQAGDVVITTEAPLGEVAQLDGTKIALAQRLIALRGQAGRLNNTYLKFALQSDFVQDQLASRSTGTTVLGIRQSELRKVLLPVPPMDEQERIAVILGTMDNKIELNRRTNDTLESMGRTLFRSWFVDFDPVRAKADGRRPLGLDAATSSLFPAAFKDSTFGSIPEGWKVSRIEDEVELAYGRALKESDRISGDVPVYGSNGVVGTHDQALVQGPGVIVGRKGCPGIVTWSNRSFFPIDTAFYVVIKNSKANLYFWRFALELQNLASLDSDSAVPGLSRSAAYARLQVVPPAPLYQRFAEFAGPLADMVEANQEQTRSIVTLRNTLLPKLLSGELSMLEATLGVARV